MTPSTRRQLLASAALGAIANIPARGVSPAQWGFRANDASGNPIFDSLGLIQVLNVVLNWSPPNAVGVTSTNTVRQLIPSGTNTFVATRPQSFLGFFSFGASFLANGTAGPAYVFMEIVDPTSTPIADSNLQSIIVGTAGNGMCLLPFSISQAGTCTVNLYVDTAGIPPPEQFNVQQMAVAILRLGN